MEAPPKSNGERDILGITRIVVTDGVVSVAKRHWED